MTSGRGDAARSPRRAAALTRARAREWASVYLKGIAMGAADTVPGVSGGTIALITGIYERLVAAVASLDPAVALLALRLHRRDGRADLVAAIREMDVPFLAVLGAGVVTAVVALSGLLAVALEAYRSPMNAFFFGLIGASAVVLYREVSVDTPRRAAAAVVAAAFAFVVTGATAGGGLPHSPAVLFATGAVTSSAMLLPGISGAALLYILGQYEFMIDALHRFIDALGGLAGGAPVESVVAPGLTVGVFLAGVAVGLLTVARVVRWALRRSRSLTLVVLVSLMLGSLRLPAANVARHTPEWSAVTGGAVVGAALVGGALVLLLDRYTDDLEY